MVSGVGLLGIAVAFLVYVPILLVVVYLAVRVAMIAIQHASQAPRQLSEEEQRTVMSRWRKSGCISFPTGLVGLCVAAVIAAAVAS
jgi:hypothetical protein